MKTIENIAGRQFNTEGSCKPNKHYMVNLDDRMEKIKREYIDPGKYFVINCGRQYGKTTTLAALSDYLKDDYIVVSLDFQELDSDDFISSASFSKAFADIFVEAFRLLEIENGDELIKPVLDFLSDNKERSVRDLFSRLSRVCGLSPKKIVLLVDEADHASNNQVFIDFLSQLRKYYLNRDAKPVFWAVVLAGVYDIKNLKLKIRPDEEHRYNSPWNIAAKFNITMSFTKDQIAGMLHEYENDHHIGMDIEQVSQVIFDFTSGYPYLVSAICKLLDEEIPSKTGWNDQNAVWCRDGVIEAVKYILDEKIPLFESMVKYLNMHENLRNMVEQIIYEGKKIPYNPDNGSIDMGMMHGFFRKENNEVIIANRIFETRFLNMFISEEAERNEAYHYGQRDRNIFVHDGRPDMKLVLERFIIHYSDIYGDNDAKFIEEYGRKFFLLYLKPIINGTGNYYLEAQTRDARRTDVVVDYLGEQFVIELKIWHGNEYNERGEQQLSDYLEYYHLNVGYMLSFNFNKNKKTGINEIDVNGKKIVEAVV